MPERRADRASTETSPAPLRSGRHRKRTPAPDGGTAPQARPRIGSASPAPLPALDGGTAPQARPRVGSASPAERIELRLDAAILQMVR